MPKERSPKVSVITPVYQGDSYLVEAVESILNQTFSDFEFLIICDDPTDETREILDTYMQEDARVKVHYNQKREGLVNSLNKGISLAKGEYIARMDSDDISHPERFEKQLEFFHNNRDISILGTDVIFINRKGESFHDITVRAVPTDPKVIRWVLLFNNCIRHPTVMFRMGMCNCTGIYSTDFNHCEDFEFWLRASQKVNIANLPDKLLFLRKHRENISELYEDAGKVNAIIAGHKAMSNLLNKKIKLCEVQTFWYPCKVTNERCVFDSAVILCELYHVFSEMPGLNHAESHQIKRDAAERMSMLAIIAFITCDNGLTLSLRIWRLAYNLDQKSAIKSLFSPLCILIAKLYKIFKVGK